MGVENTEDNQYSNLIIGVLAQNIKKGALAEIHPKLFGKPYIGKTYKDFLESGGAKVYLINCDIDTDKAKDVYNSINGLILPGGSASVKNSNYARIAKLFKEWAVRDMDEGERYFPIFGICLGFQFLLREEENENENCLSETSTRDFNLNLKFELDVKKSKMFSDISQKSFEALTSKSVTYNFHRYSFELDNVNDHPDILKMYKMLAVSIDPKSNKKFVAAIEGRKYPFYGVQWHPEKNAHETYPQIDHSDEGITASKHFLDFFLKEASKSSCQPRIDFDLSHDKVKVYDTRDAVKMKYMFVFDE